jgi:hypothetical protein
LGLVATRAQGNLQSFAIDAEAASVQGKSISVSKISSWKSLDNPDFLNRWDALAASTTEPNAYNESWYLFSALKQFDPGDKVKLFTLWQGAAFQSDLLAIMPLSSENRYDRWPLPSIQNWMHTNAFLGSPLVRAGCERAFWDALLPILDDQPGRSLFFHLNLADCEGEVVSALHQHCRENSRAVGAVFRSARALLEGELTPNAYYENAVRSKKRKELRRQKNRLSELGELTFSRNTGDKNIDCWIDEFLALERRGWKGKAGSALDCAHATRNLFRDALFGAQKLGKLELLDLRLDGRPIAMLVNFLSPPGSFSFKTAFDEDLARFSPGVLLQIENLVLLEREGIVWCDSCAVEGHPMIDSLWTGRRNIGRYSVAIGGPIRRALFKILLTIETFRGRRFATNAIQNQNIEDAGIGT